jgi:hypothetical protein
MHVSRVRPSRVNCEALRQQVDTFWSKQGISVTTAIRLSDNLRSMSLRVQGALFGQLRGD